jgi:uncharacterized damage-inducible protein DinB
MVRTLASRFQRWFKQEQDAHAKVLRSLESVPTDRRSGTEFQKAVNILAHVAAARKIWLIRLGLIHGQGSLTPKEMTLPDVEQMLDLVHGHWSGYLERVTDEELGGGSSTRAWTPAGSATESRTSWRSSSATPRTTAARSPCWSKPPGASPPSPT